MTTIVFETPAPVAVPFPFFPFFYFAFDNYAVYDAGTLTVSGTVTGLLTVGDGGQLTITGDTTQSLVTTGGTETIDSSGNASSAAVAPGGTQTIHGTASNTTIFGGGTQNIDAGVLIGSGTAVNTTIDSGGVQNLNGSEFVILGHAFVFTATANSNTVNAGGRVNVNSHGLSENGTISGVGATELVFSGGESEKEMVANGGTLAILPGGTTSGDVVSSGGTEDVFPGSTVANTIDGGTVNFVGAISNSSITFDAGGSLVIFGTSMPTFTPISNFSPGDTINLANVTFDPKGSVALTANGIQVMENGIPFALEVTNLPPPAPGLSFFLTQGPADSTNIKAHFRSDTNDFNSDGTSDVLI